MKKLYLYLIILLSSTLSMKAQDCIDESSYPPRESKDTLSVAFMIPLDLDQSIKDNKLSKAKFDQYTKYNYNIYQGVLIALDSIGSRYPDMPYLDAYIIDTKSDTAGLDYWLSKGLGSMDMIFSTLTKENEKIINNIAPSKTPLVAITSLSTPSTDYPYYIQVQPTLSTHCQAMTAHMMAYADTPTHHIITVESSRAVSDRAISYAGLEDYPNLKFTEDEDIALITQQLDSTKTNIIFAAFLSADLGETFLKHLARIPGYKIIVYGMPTWSSISTHQYATGTMRIYYTSGFYKHSDSRGAEFIAKYEERYTDPPNSFAVKGYESTLYLLSKYLESNSSIFLKMYEDQSPRPINDFDFRPECDGESLRYWENKNVYFIKNAYGNIDLDYR